ncbi:MAG: AbrB/MazE/SpoVT family DNA-binding domain-containing protein [Flavobacteriales bacterium]|nr:AbrB/MazE/SpoVT family DNA-binding domain-containing protein [Flavobacteriales bacterium]MCO4791622.1 AbrB/MazE/SpoVT family DNA-binding domain-containing protein [Flavobacteriales bacterium]
MKVPIIRIGNSKGLRLSKEILERYNFQGAVDLILEDNQVVIKPINEPRKDWAETFKRLDSDSEALLIPDVFDDEQFEDWV